GCAKPARSVGAHGHDAVRLRSTLFAQPDQSAPARNLVHANRLERGPLRTARERLVLADGGRVGAYGSDAVGAVCRRASGGGHPTGIPRDSGTARKAAAGARAGTGIGAVTRRLIVRAQVQACAYSGCRGSSPPPSS